METLSHNFILTEVAETKLAIRKKPLPKNTQDMDAVTNTINERTSACVDLTNYEDKVLGA